MLLTAEALGVDLVNVFGAAGPCREPAVGGGNLEAAQRSVVARGPRELGGDWFAGQLRSLNICGRKFAEPGLLLRRRWRIEPDVAGRTEFCGQLAIMFARILVRTGGDFGRQQVHDGTVLVRRPGLAIQPQKARAGALFATEATRAIEQAWREPLETD